MATRDEVLQRLRRDLAQVNKSEVARSMGKTVAAGRRSLRKWESGAHLPRADQAVLLAQALGKPDDYYLVATPVPAQEDLEALRVELAELRAAVLELQRDRGVGQ